MNNDEPTMPVRDTVGELERQLERGSLFAQAVLQRTSMRVNEAEVLLVRLVEELAAKGLVDPRALGLEPADGAASIAAPDPPDAGEAERAVGSLPSTSAISWPSIAIREDEPDSPESTQPPVDCAARMHVCQAVCCQLKFALSAEEIDSGAIKWDLGHPYIIRHDASGWCSHNEPGTRRCTVYGNRPRVCRSYSCANDSRIWSDFDTMVLNEEWITAHLIKRDFSLVSVAPGMEVPVTLTQKPA